jgi:uncharacterized protein (DUF1778 family)
VVSSAYDRAQQAIEAHERTVLTREDRDVFLSALDNPPAPTETLRNAFKLHDARVVKEK